ncbi:MAG: PAS domain S-box protein, partial [Pseudomonadota bacterium]
FMSLEYYLSRHDTQNKLSVLGEVIAKRATTALTFNDYDLLVTNLRTLKADKNVVRGCIYDENQQLAGEYQRPQEQAKCPQLLTKLQSEQNNNFSQYFVIRLEQAHIGTLYLENSREDLLQRFNQFLLFSVIILAVSVVLAIFLANQLQDVVVRPMRDLSNTLQNIMRNKDYSIRAAKENNDEIGDLVDQFNGLLGTIEEENSSLKASEERFRKLTALSPVGIFQVDPKQQLQYVNQRWRDIHSSDEETPNLQEWFDQIHPADLVPAQQAWNRLVVEQESIALELRLVRRDGSHTWIHLLAGALHDRNGELLGYLGAISDISELKAAQIQMENLAFYDPLTGLANRRLFKNR